MLRNDQPAMSQPAKNANVEVDNRFDNFLNQNKYPDEQNLQANEDSFRTYDSNRSDGDYYAETKSVDINSRNRRSSFDDVEDDRWN